MTDDLVKRLRDRTIIRHYGNGCVRDEVDDDCVEAADEIERLRVALDILQAAMVKKKPIPMPFKQAIVRAHAVLFPPVLKNKS